MSSQTKMVEQSTNDSHSVVLDVMGFGDTAPIYTWRKGGVNLDDNHFYLIVGSAFDPIDKSPNGNVLIEVDPVTKITRFYNETQLLNGFSFDENTLGGQCIKDGTITIEKFDPSIGVGEKANRLTTPRAIDGLLFDGTENVTRFVTSSSSASAKTKVAVCENFEKTVGSCVLVKFTHKNTNASPLLNVNDTGASPIFVNGVEYSNLEADHIYFMVYDGSRYNIIGHAKYATLPTSVVDSDLEMPLAFTDNVGLVNGKDSSVLHTNGITVNPYTKTLSVHKVKSDLNSKSWIDINKDAIISNILKSGTSTAFLKYEDDVGVYTVTGKPEGIFVSFTKHENLSNETPDLLVKLLDNNGKASFPSTVEATSFVGNLEGVASKAVADANGKNIASTYASKTEVNRIETNCTANLNAYKNEVANTYATKTELESDIASLDTKINSVKSDSSSTYLKLTGGKLTGALEGTSATFNTVTATNFKGNLEGNATSASSATTDSLNRVIVNTYALNGDVDAVRQSVTDLSNSVDDNYASKSDFNTKITELNHRIDSISISGGGVSYTDLDNLGNSLRTELNEYKTYASTAFVETHVYDSNKTNVETRLTTLETDLAELDEAVVEMYETFPNTYATKKEVEDLIANADFDEYLTKTEASTTYATQTDVTNLANSITEGFEEFSGTVAKSYVTNETFNELKLEVESLKRQLAELTTYCDLTFVSKAEYQAQIQESLASLD